MTKLDFTRLSSKNKKQFYVDNDQLSRDRGDPISNFANNPFIYDYQTFPTLPIMGEFSNVGLKHSFNKPGEDIEGVVEVGSGDSDITTCKKLDVVSYAESIGEWVASGSMTVEKGH